MIIKIHNYKGFGYSEIISKFVNSNTNFFLMQTDQRTDKL